MAEPSHEPHQELKGEIPHDDAADPENVGKAGESDPAQSAQVDAENGGKADIDGSQDAVEGEQAAVVHEELMNFALAEAGSPYALDDELEEAAESNEDEERANSIELIERISKQLSEKPVPVRVHDITIIGNTKTKDSVIEAQLEELRRVKTMQELIQKASYAKTHLQELGIFDKCLITLDAGPEELPQTANVVVEVEEAQRPFSGDIGFYSKPEVMFSIDQCLCKADVCVYEVLTLVSCIVRVFAVLLNASLSGSKPRAEYSRSTFSDSLPEGAATLRVWISLALISSRRVERVSPLYPQLDKMRWPV